ncbi:glycoside hydrolase family 13 protein [Actinotalea sp. M2MS4P-6]|uniref:glycoside hydrolase family 13 protein n=1 Tax=Actinotalea sp. M2MS4P-6 TaxID=2983762 RepID=UPI0021E4E861|nr:glycoside hydrolase family 13 protein [Actinotalea sp. M2MS4P-6]MCV2393888.1 glycoside hydrolase family 13 protein [Actinotalea sp. M2MS4P-6]
MTVTHPPATSAEWWRDAVVYQVYPRSFADANGDGVGDLPGATSRLTHLRDLGVDAVWLSPFYVSPQNDGGYDVADYRDIDPVFGTLPDADAFVAEAHRLGLRVLVDLVPNHTSWEHPWFVAALAAAPGSPERARYLFRDGRGPGGDEPPNNWLSTFGGSAWTRVTEPDGSPGQWYLHLFDHTQPDLDWSNPEVRTEFEAVLRFWLDRDVDGFRIDVAHGMVKHPDLPDWTGRSRIMAADDDAGADDGSEAAGAETGDPGADDGMPEGPMWDQDGVHDIYRSWHRVLSAYPGERAMVAEAWVEPLSRLAAYVRPDELQQTFNFAFLMSRWEAGALRDVISGSLAAMDSVGATTTWVLSNHDVVRHTSRLGLGGGFPPGIGADDPQPDAVVGLRRARAASLMMLALPGSAYLYQGEELGLPEHTTLDDDLRQDPVWTRTAHTQRGRDGCRVPLPWHADAPAYGFSPTGASWLPQPSSFGPLAVDRQTGVPGSTLELYRAALRLRRERRLGLGPLAWVDLGEEVTAFRNADLLVVTNLGAPIDLPAGYDVVLRSDDRDDRVVGTDSTVWALSAAR